MANWNDLPDEMKELVIKEMTIETRAQLKKCSKRDKRLVESTPVIYDELCLTVIPDHVTLKISRNQSTELGCDLDVTVQPDHNTITIQRESSFKIVPCERPDQGEDEIEKMFESVLSTGNLRFNKLVICHKDFPGLIYNCSFTIHAKSVHFQLDTEKFALIEWLDKLAPGVEYIKLEDPTDKDYLGGELFAKPVIVNAKSLEIDYLSGIYDEQLLNLKCTNLKVCQPSDITGHGINQLIKKLFANDYPIGTSFQMHVNDYPFSQTWTDVIEGLEIEIRESREEENEYGRLIETRNGQIKMNHGKRMEVSYRDDMFSMSIESS